MQNQEGKNLVMLSPKSLPVLSISADILAAIIDTVGSLKAETGGVLGRKEDSPLISHFHFDEGSKNSGVTYTPDHNNLNKLFTQNWNPKGIRLAGFIHSHPGEMSMPSYGDEIYAKQIIEASNLEFLWLPIINTIPNTNEFRLTPWIAYPAKEGGQVVKAKIKITTESINAKAGKIYSLLSEFGNQVLEEVVISGNALNAAPAFVPAYQHRPPVSDTGADVNLGQTFGRVQQAYDLGAMADSRIICVGAGGAASWIEELTRASIGQFVLIDPDVVSETNLSTQQTYRRDIGRFKVNCIEERIRDINPNAKVIVLPKRLEDISDEEFRYLAADAIEGRYPGRTVICGLTDNFYAQARINRLSLNLGLASLSAQVYREGRGAEVTFTYPGITPACHRCILSSRYKYFLEQGQKNTVTSHGTPIFATTRLNAIKGFILLAILHHGSNHPRWGDMLNRIGNRNLIQIRMCPDFTETMGISVFDRVFEKADKMRLFFDETVWLPQEQECPETGYAVCCPDCGGTGDLQNAIRTFTDTRIMRPYPAQTERKAA